jgi:hypothetical protein
MSSKLVEAAWTAFNKQAAAEARQVFQEMSDGKEFHEIGHDRHAPLKAAILAFLEAALEDEATIVAVADGIIGASAGPANRLSEVHRNAHDYCIRRSRASLRALIQQVKS